MISFSLEHKHPFRHAQKQNNTTQIKIVRKKIIRKVEALSQKVQPSPTQMYENPKPLDPAEPTLASIGENDDEKMIMLTLNENVDADIMMKGMN